ncbi:hypothetical protein TBR22_A49190 [Luteitalea sp. TBR-22]|nr:hypothetical protein TBR22_A49190 [Luteitalea sp. TBR-22]
MGTAKKKYQLSQAMADTLPTMTIPSTSVIVVLPMGPKAFHWGLTGKGRWHYTVGRRCRWGREAGGQAWHDRRVRTG